MKRWKELRSQADETGAALVLVLIIMMVVAIGCAGLLAFADASVRTTVALRGQGVDQYTADGAGQVAVNQLRADKFNGVAAGCSTAAGTGEVLSDVYPASNGQPAASAFVNCTPHPDNSGSGPAANSSPGSAMLSLGTGQGGEDGIWDGSNNTRTFKVDGGIFSNSNINLGDKSSQTGALGNLNSVIANVSSSSYVFAMGNCSGPGAITVTGSTTKTCNYITSAPTVAPTDRRGWDPQSVRSGTSFDSPPAPTVERTPDQYPCTGKTIYNLHPGLYTSAAALNALTTTSSNCAGSIVHFWPGNYYFNFTDLVGPHKWTNSAAWVVAGTLTGPLNLANPPAMTRNNPWCVGPGKLGSSPSSGVEFIFGGDSRMDFTQQSATQQANIEICASNASSGPPIAIYGLKTDIAAAGTMPAVPALSGCITATPYVSGGDSAHCAVIQSYQDNTPTFTVHGTVYTPSAPIDIVFNGSSAQYFQWGLVARTILVNSTGSATSMTNATISVPSTAPTPFAVPNIMYLDVYVCPGSSTCSASGTLRLKAKVQVSTTTPTVKVLSWSGQR